MTDTNEKDKTAKLQGHIDAELEALYQKANRDEPSAEIDTIITNAAHKANEKPARHTYPWFAGIAASILVGIIFIRIYPQSVPESLVPKSTPGNPAPNDAMPTVELKTSGAGKTLRSKPEAESGNMPKPATLASPARLDQLRKKQFIAPSLQEQRIQQADMELKSAKEAANEQPTNRPAITSGKFYKPVNSKDSTLMNSTTPAAPPGTDNTSGTITDAKTMLNQIQKLLDDGKTTEARNLFRQFNQQYPGYPVDPGMLKQFQTGTNN